MARGAAAGRRSPEAAGTAYSVPPHEQPGQRPGWPKTEAQGQRAAGGDVCFPSLALAALIGDRIW